MKTRVEMKTRGEPENTARHPPPRSGLVQLLSILTTDIGFTKVMGKELIRLINELSDILFRKYKQYR